jgi:uncharacterized pyridoxal phosphate-containing UPF0001 family protein
MAIDRDTYHEILTELGGNVRLVAVSKTKPIEDIQALYAEGQRDFGENYVQELADKQQQLPADIRWHFIGHLQSNKVKYIIPFVQLIHGVDSLRLLKEIDRQAAKAGRVVDVLLQVFIAQEETKFGLDAAELAGIMKTIRTSPAAAGTAVAGTPVAGIRQEDAASPAPGEWGHIRIRGLMGMASNSDDPGKVRQEFRALRLLFDTYFSGETGQPGSSEAADIPPAILSMGMSGDYKLAVTEGSTMVRIGSLLFGKRG